MIQWDFGITAIEEDDTEATNLPIEIDAVKHEYRLQLKHTAHLGNTFALDYKVSLSFLERLDNSTAVLELNKTRNQYASNQNNTFKNDFETILESVIYPIQLRVDNNASILKIQNHTQILKRWTFVEKELYAGAKTETYKTFLNDFAKLIKDDNQLLNTLKLQDWFINLFFIDFQTETKLKPKSNFALYHYPLPTPFTSVDVIHYHDQLKTDVVLKRKGILQTQTPEGETSTKQGSINLNYYLQDGAPIWDTITGIYAVSDVAEDKNSIYVQITNLNTSSSKPKLEQLQHSQMRVV